MDKADEMAYAFVAVILIVVAVFIGHEVGANREVNEKCTAKGLIAIKDVYGDRFCVEARGDNNE